MTPLPKQFRRDQFDFTQRVDLHPVYIYQKAKGQWVGYEVVIARERGECTIKDRTIQAGWAYPSSEQWGTYGWSVETMEQAKQKAFELVDSPAYQHCPTSAKKLVNRS